MQGSRRRGTTRRLAALTVGVVTAVGLVVGAAGATGAATDVPRIEKISVTSKRVPAGGLLLIGVQARYPVPEEFAVSLYPDRAKADMIEQTCDTGTGPGNGDNPSCEYDNRFTDDTSTVGLIRVAPDASGSFTVFVCTETVSFGGGPNAPDDRCKVRKFRIT